MVCQSVAAFVEKNALKDSNGMGSVPCSPFGGSPMWRLIHAIDEKSRMGAPAYLTRDDVEKAIREEELNARFGDVHARLEELHAVVLELARKSMQPLDVAQMEPGNK